jgi:hypothetical protein
VSLFVASPEIEGRNAVEADNWAKHKKTFYSESLILEEYKNNDSMMNF